MAKITRKTQIQFAGSAANIGEFGSLQLGTKVLSTDPASIMSGIAGAWLGGWSNAVVSGQNLPSLEEMNGIQYVNTWQLGYLLQEGIPEYDAGTTYFTNSIVKQAGTYKLYGSKIDTNVGNALSNTSDWQFLIDLSNPESNIIWGGTAGGTANAITITSTLSALPTPAIILFLASANNTAASTLVVGTAPSINITKGSNGAVALAPNDMTTGKLIAVIYDGTQGQLLNPPAFAHGADVASATTTVLDGTGGDILNITGTTGITAVTLAEGRFKICKFSGILTLTYSSSLLLNTNGGNYTTAANDVVYFYGLASGVVVGTIFPANGQSPVAVTAPAYGANTVVANATTGTAQPTGIALAASQLIGRLLSGNVAPVPILGALQMTASGLTNPLQNQTLLTSSGTFTTPTDSTTTTIYKITLVGPGGGGAGTAGARSAPGGGAGGTVIGYKSGLAASTACTYTQGAAGTGGASGNNNGNSGGNSTFVMSGTTFTANGGAGGQVSSGSLTGQGGLGGTASGGTLNNTGGDGGGATMSNEDAYGGVGGASSQGGGGTGGLQDVPLAAQNGKAPGSGGGGGGGSGSQAQAGGNGLVGFLLVERISG